MGVDNYFIFDGVDCRRFAIHAFERSSYGADPIQYEARTIPGMDGDCLVSQDRYPNRNVSVKCLIFEDFYVNYERFRAWLMSKVGYFRLELGNHPGEFYLASVRNAIEPTVDRDANMGKFELIFSRKPQRFLKSGERVVTYPSVKEKSGSVVKINDAAAGNALDVTIGIEPIQDLHGYDHPWPAGGGKNLFDKTATDTSNGYVANKYFNGNSGNEVNDSDCNISEYIFVKPNQAYTVYGVSGSNVGLGYYTADKTLISGQTYAITWGQIGTKTFTTPSNCAYIRLSIVKANIDITQLEVGSTATAYEPYSNICPISGRTRANVVVSPTTNAQDGTTYDITFPTEAGTVYGGTLDVTTGLLTVDRGNIASYAGETLPGAWISSMDVYTAGGTPTTGAQVVYELATPITYQLTPIQIALLAGVNNVWADTGDIRLQYTAQSIIINPTPYASKPLIRVYGTGEVGIEGTTVTVTSADVYTDIDCEIMESYKGDTPKNQYVEFSMNDYPTLAPGSSSITLGTGITRVDVTPRWFIR